MRVLAVATPALGHLYPSVPLLWALRALGHEVLVATAGDATRVAEAGLPVIDVLPGETMTSLFDDYQALDPGFFTGLRERPMTSMADLAPLFGHIAGRLVEPVRAVARQWRPDLVVTTHGQGAGPRIASELGVPVLEHGFGFARSHGVQDAVRKVLDERFGAVGAPPVAVFADVAVPSMTPETEGTAIRAVPYNGGAVVPGPLLAPPERPRVLVTMGTQVLRSHGLAPLEWLPAAAARLDAEFLLAADGADLSALGPLPPGVRVLPWTPLSALLPSCSAVVHHGGSGTTMAALWAGVPQLVVPALADNHINARAVEARGVGIHTTAPTSDALAFLLHEEEPRRAAREVAAEIRALPSPAALATRLSEPAGSAT
ncbi:nucleotide disphospho-sugar-binding domain-containing protein [Streptomyces abikoensis]|uniref:nucleotide disphospho-sugar-binding domain-containing protein n=1 Tax=Streptomyces abikoensis TaxID=97398 RepID=UPI003719870D